MARDPKQIQSEIDQARHALAATLDEIAYRTSPKKIAGDAQTATKNWLASPAGKAAVGVVVALVAVRIIVKIRNR